LAGSVYLKGHASDKTKANISRFAHIEDMYIRNYMHMLQRIHGTHS
jgi:hypothetical protein